MTVQLDDIKFQVPKKKTHSIPIIKIPDLDALFSFFIFLGNSLKNFGRNDMYTLSKRKKKPNIYSKIYYSYNNTYIS